MEGTVWSELGIEPTADERAIKRAYAVRVKVTSPEADPAGYMKLRAAYEWAKNYARTQQQFAQLQEVSPACELSDSPVGSEPLAPEAVVRAAPAATPQKIAIGELHALLVNKELERFLQRLKEIKAAGIFASLDDQYHFVGSVAVMIDDVSIEDSDWRGRVGQVLGAREHENIFTDNPRYWHAYEALLRDYIEMRAARAQAHLEQEHDDSAAPGYLHVFHVLTAPFDAERMGALTRSQRYHRIAGRLLERAKNDSSIVIPLENREWWERTAMAGQHWPVADAVTAPAPAPAPEPAKSSGGIPFWVWWMAIVLLLNLARCSSSPSHTSSNLEKLQKFQAELPVMIERDLANQEDYDEVLKCLAAIDPQIRLEIVKHLYRLRGKQRFSGPDGRRPPLPPPESDPMLASFLAECRGAGHLDAGGQVESQPPAPAKGDAPAGQ